MRMNTANSTSNVRRGVSNKSLQRSIKATKMKTGINHRGAERRLHDMEQPKAGLPIIFGSMCHQPSPPKIMNYHNPTTRPPK